ncbi:hypothetical protein TNCV_363161 [Trichonephila clavipes]|nr:hypothetical protein TNCV_363161 [Trichonephila clavipes]
MITEFSSCIGAFLLHNCRSLQEEGNPHHGRAADFFGGAATHKTTELSFCDDCNFFVCAEHLREGRSDGRSPVPKLQLQFLYLPCLQETDFGGMFFLSPPLRANCLAKGAYILTPAGIITPINNWECQRIFPLENKTTKRQRPLRWRCFRTNEK